MLQLIGRTLLWLRGETFRLLVLAGVLLLIWGTVAPVGTLIWWLSQGAQSLGLQAKAPKQLSEGDRFVVNRTQNVDCYIVFLPGVGDFSANELTSGEEFFLHRLVEHHPNCVAVSDVFPYSAANQDLGRQRLLAPMWRTVENASGWLKNADVLIKIRNLWRFAISADERYGSVYNQGIATAIIERMEAMHPIDRDHPLKLILIGTSGGVQVSLGAATYLNQWLNAQLFVVSVGGVFNCETGFDQVAKVIHLQGERDWIEDISYVFPSCWSWSVASPFNQARLQGRYTVLNSGPQAHDGEQGYFGTAIAHPPHTTYVQLTLEQVNRLPIWSRPTTKK